MIQRRPFTGSKIESINELN